MKWYPVSLRMPSEQHLLIRPAYNSESGLAIPWEWKSQLPLPSVLPSVLPSGSGFRLLHTVCL